MNHDIIVEIIFGIILALAIGVASCIAILKEYLPKKTNSSEHGNLSSLVFWLLIVAGLNSFHFAFTETKSILNKNKEDKLLSETRRHRYSLSYPIEFVSITIRLQIPFPNRLGNNSREVLHSFLPYAVYPESQYFSESIFHKSDFDFTSMPTHEARAVSEALGRRSFTLSYRSELNGIMDGPIYDYRQEEDMDLWFVTDSNFDFTINHDLNVICLRYEFTPNFFFGEAFENVKHNTPFFSALDLEHTYPTLRICTNPHPLHPEEEIQWVQVTFSGIDSKLYVSPDILKKGPHCTTMCYPKSGAEFATDNFN